MTMQDLLSAPFITIFLSSASDLIASHPSLERLEYPRGLSMALNRSDASWIIKVVCIAAESKPLSLQDQAI